MSNFEFYPNQKPLNYMQRFYLSNPADGILDETDSKHCVKVLRKKKGDHIVATDGKGTLFHLQIMETNPKACSFKIIKDVVVQKREDYRLHIAIAPTKQMARFEWFLEKAVEIGIDEITPLITRYSERDIVKPDRLEKILIAAMKQSLGVFLPKLNPIVSFKNFIKDKPAAVNNWIAYTPNQKDLLNNHFSKGDTLALIGPEGGFSEDEALMANQAGYQAISLGINRLRTETAGIVICQAVKTLSS